MMSRGHTRIRWRYGLPVLATWLCTLGASAADTSFPALRRIDVPAGQAELWATNPALIAVPRDEFEWLLAAAKPAVKSPPAAVLTSAIYEATLLDHTLAGGKLRLTVHRSGSRSVWQRLSPWNLALTGIAWSDREAVAGTAPDGQFWLWNDRPEGELIGGWSARGIAVGERTEFELHRPEAVSTVLRLRTVRGSKVNVENGFARILDSDAARGWELWEIETSDPNVLRFRVADPPGETTVEPLISFRQQLAAEVREDHIRFQSRFETEVWGGAARELLFSIPSSVELYAVSQGADTNLQWTRESPPGSRHTVRVQLPEPGRGVLRPLILEGIIGSRVGAATAIPQLELVNGLFQSGQQTVTVMRPMQIAALRMIGCRQGAPLIVAPDSETLTVEQLLPGALLALDLRRPTSALTAQVLSQVDLQSESWIQTTHVLWTTNSGSVFQAALRIPPQWEVTDVDAFHAVRGAERITWEKVDESGGSTVIRLEFFQAIAPGQPRLMRILTRRRASGTIGEMSCPIPVPLDCTVQEAVLALQAQPRFRVSPAGESAFDAVGSQNLSDAWWRQPEWTARMEAPSLAVWLRGTDLARFGSLRLEAEPTPVACQADTLVELAAPAQVVENYRLTIEPKSQPCDRVLVWLSEPGPDVNWQIESPSGLQLIAHRLPAEQLPIWELPLEGDLWEIRLPPIEESPFVLKGRRLRTQPMPGRAGLAFVPQAQSFAGSLEFRSPEHLSLELLPHGLLATSAGSTNAPRSWRYAAVRDELRWVSRSAPRVESSTLARLELRTLVSAPDEPFDYHRAVCVISQNRESLQFQFPAGCEPLTAALNGTDLGRLGDGTVTVPPLRNAGEQRLALSYRTRSQRGFLMSSRSVPAPVCSEVVWTGFRWEFSLPPTTRLWAEPTGVRLARPLPRSPWTERLFGPFGRPINESIFWPWSSASWSNLLKPPVEIHGGAPVTDPEWTAPAGWATYLAYAPEPPVHLQFSIWRGNRIQLLAWIGVLASVILGLNLRRAGWSYRDQISALALAGMIAAAWLADPPLTELVGGVCTGTLFAMLVPRRWFDPAPSSVKVAPKVGSTRSFTLPPIGSAATMVLLAAGWLCSAEAPTPSQFAGENILLVPVDQDGEPSRKLPLVYTTPDVLRSLREAAEQHAPSSDPNWVFERAVYRVKLTHESPAVIFAAYDILIASSDSVVTVPLPLRGSGLSGVASCRVDGRPAALSTRPDAAGFQVAIARPEFPVSALGEQPLTRHTVMVEMYRPWQADGSGAGVSFRIPGIHDTRAVVDGLTVAQSARFPSAAGQIQPQDSAAGLVAEYGPVDELHLRWALGGVTARHTPAECQLESAELLVVSPNSLQSRTKTVITPQAGALRRLSLKLPKGAVLQDLQTVPAAGYRVRAGASEAQAVDFEFANELRQPLTVRCQYVLPKPAQAPDFIWNGPSWSSPDPVTWMPRQRVLAVGAVADLRVQPQSVEDSGLAPLALDTARELLEDLIVDVRPKELYQVSGERPIPFRNTAADAQRRLTLWQQQGTLRRDRLIWTMEAVLDPPASPLYSHVLSVDRQLKIESISVRERNAERRLRWSEVRPVVNSAANKVTVFLTDPMTESQTLTVVASLPVSGAGSLVLPNVRVETAVYQKARLALTADPAWQLEWHSLRGLKRILKPLEPNGPESGASDEEMSSWEYDVQDADWKATVRVRPFDEIAAIRAVHALLHSSVDTVDLHSRIEIPAFERSAPLVIELPRPWELQSLPQTAGVQVENIPEEATGWTRFTIAPDAAGPLTLRWQARAGWSQFPPGECPLPSWHGAGGHEVHTWVAEIATPPFLPRLQTAADDEFRNPPAWAADWLTEMAPMAAGLRWVGQLADNASRWPLATAPERREPAHIAWLEHRLWRQPSEPDTGVSRLQLAAPLRQLTMLVPDHVQVVAAVVDDRPGSLLTAHDENERRLSAADGQPFQEALVYWHSDTPPAASWSGLVETAWITFPAARVEQQAVTIFPAGNEVFLPLRGWSSSDAVDRTLQRLESLSDMLTASANRSHDWAETRLRSGYEIAAEKLSHHAETLNDSHPQRQERWQTIVDSMERLPPDKAAHQSAADGGAALDDLLADHPAAKYGLLNPAADRTWSWRFDDRMLRLLGACVLFLAAMLALRIAMRPAWRTWLRAHPNGAVALLGLAWWLCLTPSIFGLAVLLWAIYRALATPRVAESPAAA